MSEHVCLPVTDAQGKCILCYPTPFVETHYTLLCPTCAETCHTLYVIDVVGRDYLGCKKCFNSKDMDPTFKEILETVNKVCRHFRHEPIDQITFDKVEHLAEVALKEKGYEAILTCNDRTNPEATALKNALGLELTYRQHTYKLEFRNDLAITLKNGEVWVVTE